MANAPDTQTEKQGSEKSQRSTRRRSNEAAVPLRTRVSASWTAVVVAAFVLILLIIFIAQNTHRSSVNFLWLHGSAPTAVVLLIAAVAGALIVVTVAVARILQLRRSASSRSED
jgi:uncharacterized integral membrane protein